MKVSFFIAATWQTACSHSAASSQHRLSRPEADPEFDGTRTFTLLEGEPLETSYGEDLYRQILVPNEQSENKPDLSLAKDAPLSRPVQPPALGKVIQIPQVGGLHHLYIRKAA